MARIYAALIATVDSAMMASPVELKRMGTAKLEALFTKDELAHLSTLGNAASHINETVPGTINGSGTASTLLNEMQANKAATQRAATVGSGIGTVLGMGTIGTIAHGLEGGVGGAVAGLAGKALEPIVARRAANSAQRKLAEALLARVNL
nr:hypothetical protein [uncultured Sphingomonas sp.]